MPDIGAVAKSTIAERIKKLPDAIIDKSCVMKKYKEKGVFKFGKGGSPDIRFPIRVEDSRIGGSANKWGETAGKTTQPFQEAVFAWRPYKWLPMINEYDVMLNSNASPLAKLFDMVNQQLNEVRQSATAQLTRHIYGDATATTGDEAGSTPAEGYESLILASGTFGGLSRATYTALNSQLTTSTDPSADGNNNDLTNLYEDMQTCFLNCSKGASGTGNDLKQQTATDFEQPDFIVGTQTNFEKYWRSLEPRVRYSTAQAAGPLKKLMFGPAEFEWDPFCTANRIYFINTSMVEIWCATKEMLSLAKVIEKEAPVVKIYVLITQLQHFFMNPRYFGKVTTSGT